MNRRVILRIIEGLAVFSVLFALVLDGCAKEKPASNTPASSGNTDATPVPSSAGSDSLLVVLKQGQSTHLPQHPDDALSFVNVPQDSRCPIGVQCVWEGDGTVVLAVLTAGTSDTTQIELHTSSKFATQTTYKDLNIRLQKLDPYPQKDTKIGPADYVATLTITRQ